MVSARVVISWFFPGGYGTESHNHLLGHGHTHEAPSLPLTEPEAEAEAA